MACETVLSRIDRWHRRGEEGHIYMSANCSMPHALEYLCEGYLDADVTDVGNMYDIVLENIIKIGEGRVDEVVDQKVILDAITRENFVQLRDARQAVEPAFLVQASGARLGAVSSISQTGCGSMPQPRGGQEEHSNPQKEAKMNYLSKHKDAILRKGAIIVPLLILAIFLAIKMPLFYEWENIRNLLVQTSGIAVMAFGITFVLISGCIDLSMRPLCG